jgi:hypothetical protein
MDKYSNANSNAGINPQTGHSEAAPTSSDAWAEMLKARGWAAGAATALDVVEPFSPLVAQVLWVVQPISGVFGARALLHDLAQTLEDPQQLAHLRQQLET